MSSSIKDEYTRAESKPAAASVTIRSVLVATGAILMEQFIEASPIIAMGVYALLPSWLQGFLTLEIIQNGLVGIFLGIAGAAGISIVKERVKKGDIQGIVKPKTPSIVKDSEKDGS